MTSTEGYADKIDKLLRKAESTTPQEAEALRDKAFELMAKFRIDQAEIDARRKTANGQRVDEKIIEKAINITGIFRFGLARMAHDVAMAFESVDAYQYKEWQVAVTQANGSVRYAEAVHYVIVGFESDVEQILIMLTSLQIQAATEMVTWWKSYPGAPLLARGPAFRAKRQFIISFGVGAGQKIRLSVRRAKATASSGAELVLYDRKQMITQHMAGMGLRKSRSRLKGGTWDAQQAGYSAGQQANTGDKPIDERATSTTRRELES